MKLSKKNVKEFLKMHLILTQLTDMTYQINPGSYTMIIMEQPKKKRFVRYFSTQVEELNKVYETVYLIRNERKYHLYSFDDGKRFEPDYILILGNKSTVVEQQQIFIEPKGQHLIDNDIWKEHFLLQLEDDSKCIAYPDYDNYSVKGLPFYTHNVKEQRFKEYFEKLYKHN